MRNRADVILSNSASLHDCSRFIRLSHRRSFQLTGTLRFSSISAFDSYFIAMCAISSSQARNMKFSKIVTIRFAMKSTNKLSFGSFRVPFPSTKILVKLLCCFERYGKVTCKISMLNFRHLKFSSPQK